jgi:hypothetical protein
MSTVTLDLPLLEAMALVKRLNGRGGMTAAEADALQRGHQRLAKALQGSGAPQSGIETIAEELVGERVRIKTTSNKTYVGELERISGFRTAIVKDKPFSHPINLSRVESIEPVRVEAAA